MSTIEDVHRFWFESISDEQTFDTKSYTFKKWFIKNSDFDKSIKDRFEETIKQADAGVLDHWKDKPKGVLSLVVLLDQFPRNIYRNTPDMFRHDSKALSLTEQTIKDGKDKELILIERVFLYMPLQHAEDREVQQLSLKCFLGLVEESRKNSPQNTHYYEYTYQYAKKHCDVIDQFGRFPHRNNILNRSATSKEELYLSKPGSGF